MSRYSSNSRFLPIVLIVIIMIIAIVALVSLARAIFFSGGNSDSGSSQVVDTSREALLSSSVDRSVQMTVRGAIVADENFNSYRITITPSSRDLVTYRGYLGAQLDGVELGNNVAAYEQFVHALDKANLAVGEPFTGDKDDTRGICATGRLYEYEIKNGDSVVKRLWTSTCKGSPGSLDASADQLTNLFRAQIPDSQTILSKISL